MVIENGAYGLFINATSIIKTPYSTYTSSVQKNSNLFKNPVKQNTSQNNDIRENNKSGLAFINYQFNICNDTKVNAIHRKRCNDENKLCKKRKLSYNKDLSCGYCKRHRTGSSGCKNVINCTADSYSGCDTNKTPTPNALGGNIKNNSHSTHNLNMHLQRDLFNIKIAFESSKKYCDQSKHQKSYRKTSFKLPDAKLVSVGDWNNKKKVRNTQKYSKKADKNMGEFIFSYNKIKETTRLKKRSNVFTSKRRRGRSTYNLEAALSKLSLKTKEEIKLDCLVQRLAKFSINI
ncbi:hypothetical protein COBT_001991 [Conglomerata obtusa]